MARRQRESRGKHVEIETSTHGQARRRNIPGAELQALLREEAATRKTE